MAARSAENQAAYGGSEGGAGTGSSSAPSVAGKTGGADGATDIPSWARNKGVTPDAGETPVDAARRVMNEQYGAGNYDAGPPVCQGDVRHRV